MKIIINAKPLSKKLFAPYGDVIETNETNSFIINRGTTKRFHDLAEIDFAQNDGKPIINLFRSQPRKLPIVITMMERHLLGSQLFFPIGGLPYLVVVAEAKNLITPEDLNVFTATGIQGVNYHRGVWHHPLLVLQPNTDFLVIDRGSAQNDLEEVSFLSNKNHWVINF